MELKVWYLTRSQLSEIQSGMSESVSPSQFLSTLRPHMKSFTLTIKSWHGYLPEIELKKWCKENGVAMNELAYLVGGKDGLIPDDRFPSNEKEIAAQWPDMVDAPCEYRDTWCDYGQSA